MGDMPSGKDALSQKLVESFKLQSMKDDRSMLQEDVMSRKTNEERNNPDNELQEVLQPEFIK